MRGPRISDRLPGACAEARPRRPALPRLSPRNIALARLCYVTLDDCRPPFEPPGGLTFSVLFEVNPEKFDSYLGHARMLKPELEQIDGFVDNVRYRSLTRPGWLLSLSSWRDEKALVRWRTQAKHHGVQEKGRSEVFRDYHLRVGEVTRDTRLPRGQALREQRLDETEAGQGTTAT